MRWMILTLRPCTPPARVLRRCAHAALMVCAMTACLAALSATVSATSASQRRFSYSSGSRKSGSLFVSSRYKPRQQEHVRGSARDARVGAPGEGVAVAAERLGLPLLLAAAPRLHEVVLLGAQRAAAQAVREVVVAAARGREGARAREEAESRGLVSDAAASPSEQHDAARAPLPLGGVLRHRHHLVAAADGRVDLNRLALMRSAHQQRVSTLPAAPRQPRRAHAQAARARARVRAPAMTLAHSDRCTSALGVTLTAVQTSARRCSQYVGATPAGSSTNAVMAARSSRARSNTALRGEQEQAHLGDATAGLVDVGVARTPVLQAEHPQSARARLLIARANGALWRG
jgi:hypothetical protein